ncbi:MAG TPA: hypothetical protein GX708_01025 [Gallicola sp.]|nr:hypothetical protein [Gallicola sp.]
MKLKEGMYVRYKKIISYEIKISKIKEIKIYNDKRTDYKYQLIYIVQDGEWVHPNTIIKASNNIIDLIEVGDYVNGYKVSKIKNEIKGFGVIIFDDDTSIHEYNIKSIVTKEQFKSNEYVVE